MSFKFRGFSLLQKSNCLIWIPVLHWLRTSYLTNNSSKLWINDSKSVYIKGIIGLSHWYFLQNGSTKLAAKLKNNLAVINLSSTVLDCHIALWRWLFWFRKFVPKLYHCFNVPSKFYETCSHAFLFSTQLKLIISKILATIIT